MPATTEIPRFEFLIATIVSVLIAAAAQKGKRTMAFVGSSFAAIGIIFLVAGRIPQRWHGGPPVEGSLAMFGSLLIILIGFYIIFLAFFRRSRDHTQKNDTKKT
jgi:xanthine/uracil permease